MLFNGRTHREPQQSNASGDGIDSNGSISISGGTLLVSGPESSGNGALDYQTEAVISGGTAILCGSAGMAQGFSSSSAQASFMYTLDSSADAGSSVNYNIYLIT